MLPRSSPLTNLANAVVDAGIGRVDLKWIDVRRALNHGRNGPEAIARLLSLRDHDRECILIDQFEELFRFSDGFNRDQSSLLTDFIVGFSENPPDNLYILITMRSEFLGECTQFEGLAETINKTQYLLPRIDTDDLLRAVREPVSLYGGAVTERLAERLVADARGGQDELPLIQHGLSRLWQFALHKATLGIGPLLDLGEYVERGPLDRLLSDHADGVANKACKNCDGGQKIVEELFRALTDINSKGQAIRRPQTFAELLAVTGTTPERLLSIIAPFRAQEASFVSPYEPTPLA